MNKAEEHLRTDRRADDKDPEVRNVLLAVSATKHYKSAGISYFSQSRDVQAFAMIYSGFARFAWPCPFTLAVGEA